MRKSSSLAVILSVTMLTVSLISTLWLDSSLGSRIVSIVTIVTTVIGSASLFIQFKKTKKINAVSFMTDYSKSFYNCYYDLFECFSELNKAVKDPNYEIDYNKYKSKIVVYLQWNESIASLVERKVLDLYTIDNVFAYRFFLVVNNPTIQKNLLVPRAKYYRGTYYLYDIWYQYEQKRGIKMPLDETALRLTEGYQENLKKIFGENA